MGVVAQGERKERGQDVALLTIQTALENDPGAGARSSWPGFGQKRSDGLSGLLATVTVDPPLMQTHGHAGARAKQGSTRWSSSESRWAILSGR